MTDFTICYWFHFHYHHTVMSLMSYCTDANDCSLINSASTGPPQDNNPNSHKEFQDRIQEPRVIDRKSKSNCSNIRKWIHCNQNLFLFVKWKIDEILFDNHLTSRFIFQSIT